MTYDPRNVPRCGASETLTGRIAMAITMDDGDWSAGYGENRELAEIFRCNPQIVATVRMKLRRGWRPSGRPAPLPPGALTTRLLGLDQKRPGLSRVEQARILGTSHGMIRDTVYRLRKMGYRISGRSRHPMRLDVK